MEPPGNGEPKPYHCSVCGDDFKRHEHLIRHSRRHTQEKPFKCDVCQKEFARRDILSRHAIVHVPAAERAAMPQKTQKRGTKRVQQACNNCAKGKCRCDGETPCSTCQGKNLPNCEYTLSSTPAKRKRADSSASTAAANVLLQVASSAHASPKSDWADYTGQPTELSMQPPHPIVFGYQPTLNGSINHDPFMYNTSRPGSRYASRAPSPSHDYDAPFENAFPAASIFNFLFKDAARDLPGINSILPRLLPLPGYATDYPAGGYGHNGSEQPGSYSNYRNDSLTNAGPSINLTRPPSPIISFHEIEIPDDLRYLEENPLVDVFTDADRQHLQEYTQTQLPSARLLNIVVQLFFDKFHDSMPIIHRANYAAGQSESILTLAIMAVGSRYVGSIPFTELYRPLLLLTERLLKLESETFAALQAQFLLDIADLYDIESQQKLEAAEERRSTLLRKARAKKLFDQNYDSPPDDASTEARWQILRRAEERRRLSWAIWMYDNFFTVFFDIRPLMEVNEVSTSLPCSETLWEANTAHEWAAQFAPERVPLRTRTLWSTGRLEDRGAEECSQYGQYCRTILAHVEARRVYDIACTIPRGDPLGESQKLLRQDTQAVLDNAKEMSGKAFDVLEEALSLNMSNGNDSNDASLQLFFARMITFVDLQSIRKYLIGDDRSIRIWAEHERSQARAAVLLAAHIMVLVTDDRQPSPFAGMIAFYATMTLFCFAKFYTCDASAQRLQLDKCAFISDTARQWCEHGSFLPAVHNLGLIIPTNLPSILALWSAQNDHIAWWGVTSLKDRVESVI